MRFEIWVVALAVEAAAVLLRNHQLIAVISCLSLFHWFGDWFGSSYRKATTDNLHYIYLCNELYTLKSLL